MCMLVTRREWGSSSKRIAIPERGVKLTKFLHNKPRACVGRSLRLYWHDDFMAATKNSAKQVSMQFNVVFGIVGVDAIPANAAVLVNECKKRIDGELQSVTEFMAVEGVKSTKLTDLVMPILAVMLADARVRGGFASKFEVVTVGSESVKTNLKAKSAFTKWLKGNVLYKSNTQGELNKALVLDDGVYLRNTALKVSPKHGLYEAEGAMEKALLFKTAEAICKQATLFTDIHGKAKSIFDAAYAEAKKAEKKSEKAA